jgi:hypothetical protein
MEVDSADGLGQRGLNREPGKEYKKSMMYGVRRRGRRMRRREIKAKKIRKERGRGNKNNEKEEENERRRKRRIGVKSRKSSKRTRYSNRTTECRVGNRDVVTYCNQLFHSQPSGFVKNHTIRLGKQ